MRNRAETIRRLTSGDVPDILIVGGGINGVGVFRDLAAQGIPSVLVEAGDFASGTSAAPSRLIHGGLRYLETGEAKLVKESLIERNLLLQNAHHVVHPQPIWVPITHYLAGAMGAVARFLHLTTRPGPKGAIPVKIGLVLYDLFGKFHQTMPNHRMLSGRAARAEMPVLSEDVVAVGEYYDAFITHPERLVMELIADAEADCPEAFAIPYLAAGDARNGAIELVDRIEQKSYDIRPRTVINAAGAWVDRVQEGLGFSDKLMGGTRGTHLVMLKPELTRKLGGKMLYFETADHRACLALPMDDRHVYVGTTDIRVEDPDERYYTEEEIDYIFDVLKPVLPGETFDRNEIVFAMGGVRPLPKQQTAVTGQISRDHRIDQLPPSDDRPFETVVLVGGKWTTYRAFAEQVTDVILGYRDADRQRSTGELVIGGARDFPSDTAARDLWIADLAKETGLDPERCRVLAARYGATARRYAEAEAAAPGLIPGFDAYSRAEIAEMCRTERVTRLQDIVLRRTLMAFEGGLSLDKLRAVGEVAADALGWDAARQTSELDDVSELLRVKHRVDLEQTMNGERHGFAGPSLGLGPLDRSAPTPLWAQVKTALTRQIFEYGLEPGARLPSETALCQAFDVSRTVVREALAQLVNEGLIYRHQGKGAFVRDRRDEQDFVASTVGFTGELTEKRHEVARRVLYQGIVLPSPRVRKYLGLPVDEQVFAIDRVMTVDGVPRAIIRCCLLASAVPGLEEVSLENRSLHDTLMRSYGIRLNRADRWIEAITLAEDDAALLDVEAGRAALKVESVASDGRDSPMDYYNMVCLTDRSRLHVSVRSHGQQPTSRPLRGFATGGPATASPGSASQTNWPRSGRRCRPALAA